MAVIEIHDVGFDGMVQSFHYPRQEIETHVRAGASRAIIQVKREVSNEFTVEPWVFTTGLGSPNEHIVAVLNLIGKKVTALADTGMGFAPMAQNQSLIIKDVTYRVRNFRNGHLIEYQLQCISTGDVPITTAPPAASGETESTGPTGP